MHTNCVQLKTIFTNFTPKLKIMEHNQLTVFESKEIRRVWHNEEWFFSVIDVIEILTDSPSPKTYWGKIKIREFQLSPIWEQLKLKASDGKTYKTDCANMEGLFRIIMSVPSPKAEPLKLWLAQTGVERIEEIENPELAYERMKETYRQKGYTDDWIKERIQSIQTNKKLTSEWDARGIKGQEYAWLTATIAKGTFNVTPSEHKKIKGLTKPNQNLRDHMTPLELILTSLGEEVTRTVAIDKDAQGYHQNLDAAVKGGATAAVARKAVEDTTGTSVVSGENFLNLLKKDTAEPSKEIE